MRLKKLFRDISRKRSRLYFYVAGILSVLWFLIRVIPKPSRAAYPCQRAAFPIASAFVLWLVSLTGISLILKNLKRNLKQSKNLYSTILLILCLIVSVSISISISPTDLLASNASQNEEFIPTDNPNEPVGEGRGIFPGKVVWSHNPEAASWNGSEDYWWSDNSTSSIKIHYTFTKAIMELTETSTEKEAWDALFKSFNKEHAKGDIGYMAGEKIAIKVNQVKVREHNHTKNNLHNSPAMILTMLRQLVYEAGVPDSAITIYDISRHVADYLFDPCKDEFPKVHFVDISQGENGREPFQLDINTQIHWSESIPGGKKSYLPKFLTDADYIINISNLKGHSLAGITMCAKNHFGSFVSSTRGSSGPIDAGVHTTISVHDFVGGHDSFSKRDMGTYNSLVDIMGHKHLGKKTMLYIIEALYNTPLQNSELKTSHKMQMSPFDGHWMSSIFVSQDGVAIESVGLDFLRNETGEIGDFVYGNVDNYLHEAANAGSPPSGTVYNPNGDGTKLNSLGVHEHWNDPINKQYSRDLGRDVGIELVYVDASSGATAKTRDTISTSMK